MVPFAAIADVKPVNGPLVVTRYNLYPAAAINGNSAPGYSSGQTIAKMQEMFEKEKPPSMHFEWTELAYLQQEKGNTAYWVFLLAVTLVFLVLAAQYESWSLPLAVILVVPMCLLSSIVGILLAGMDINIFTQIGFVVLVGLSSKNAILIVEYAKARRENGASITQATLDACQFRLRPLMITSFACSLGVVPLVISHGAGAEMRRARHGGVRGHAWRDDVRHLLDAGFLLRDSMARGHFGLGSQGRRLSRFITWPIINITIFIIIVNLMRAPITKHR